MGLNNTESLRVVFDLETVPLPDVARFLDEPRAKKNLKDPAKIAADIEEKRAEQLDGCGLDPDLCQIVAIGWQREDWNEPQVCVIANETNCPTEAGALAEFWRQIGQRVTVGYNSIGFDFPVLLRRSMYLGVQHPFVNIDRYRTNHIDLQLRLSFNGTKPFRSLSWYCRRFGLDVPQDETKGKDIAQLVTEGNWQAVADHCRADVIKTKALAERIGLLKMQSVAELDAEAVF